MPLLGDSEGVSAVGDRTMVPDCGIVEWRDMSPGFRFTGEGEGTRGLDENMNRPGGQLRPSVPRALQTKAKCVVMTI